MFALAAAQSPDATSDRDDAGLTLSSACVQGNLIIIVLSHITLQVPRSSLDIDSDARSWPQSVCSGGLSRILGFARSRFRPFVIPGFARSSSRASPDNAGSWPQSVSLTLTAVAWQ